MKHLDEGQLRAFLDGELPVQEAQHLSGCAVCQKQLNEVKYRANFARKHLSEFLTSPVPDRTNVQFELVQIQQRIIQKEKPMFQNIFKSFRTRAAAAVLAVSMLLVIVLTVPSIRASAAQFLSIFRVQNVAILPVNSEAINQLSGNEGFIQRVQEMMSGDLEVVKEAGDIKQAADAAQASSIAGFNVRLPETDMPMQELWVEDSSTFNMTVNRDHVQAVLDELDHSDVVLPESINGQKMTVEIPAGVRGDWGICNAPSADQTTQYSIEKNCFTFYEIPSPRIETPDGLDLNQLMGIALELTGMSREEAVKFASTVDLTSSLVIPVPTDVASYETVQVDGVEGQLLHVGGDTYQAFTLIWVKDGVIYSIVSTSQDPAAILDLANHMK